ncbi:rho GTPase-activating protein 32-like [Phasianus colchicus]|uniref:rho GTPase-activating protein 32-like n=1 Tax=Phasianus colchicus TaxID=9054 RepID=UPI00129E32D2|nr:rho GTPase-activating protein 32-like [Phasianus colchicus]
MGGATWSVLSHPQLLETEQVSKLCFCRNQAVLGTSNCCQELSAALPSPCTTHDSQHWLFSLSRQNPPSKNEESPASSWCCCFSLRKPSSGSKRQLQRNARQSSETAVVVLAGESSPCQSRRSRASSEDALCASISGELIGSRNGCNSNSSLPSNNSNNSDGEKELIEVHALITGSAENADLSLQDTTVTNLDCNPVPLLCSPSQAQCECPDSSTSVQEQVSVSEEEQSLLQGDFQSGLQSQATDSSTESLSHSLHDKKG